MSYEIFSEGKLICSADIKYRDESMGVWDGCYNPLNGYEDIRELIRKYTLEVSKPSNVELPESKRLSSYRKKIEQLNLQLFKDGEQIFVSAIDLRDYSEEFGKDGYVVSICLQNSMIAKR